MDLSWNNNNDSGNGSNGGSTSVIVSSKCRTEEVEPGKYVRKCEKTEQHYRNCFGKPPEVVQSNKEYTEEDVTNEILRGVPAMSGWPSNPAGFDFPGLQRDIEVIEKNLVGGLGRLLGAAEEMANGFFDVFAKSPGIYDAESMRQGIPVEENNTQQAHSEPKELKDADLAAMAEEI